MTRYQVHMTPGPHDANDPKVAKADPVLTLLVDADDEDKAAVLAWDLLDGAVSWDVQEIEES